MFTCCKPTTLDLETANICCQYRERRKFQIESKMIFGKMHTRKLLEVMNDDTKEDRNSNSGS